MKLRLSIFITIVLVAVSAATAYAVDIPRMPRNHVVDLAGIVDDGVEMKLNGYLLELEQKTTAQVVVLTIPSLEGESLEDFSLSVAEKWKLGRKDRDNGVLILVAFEERKYRFEIGYGLEGALPDSLVGTIGRQYIVPYFRKGDYSNGTAAAVLAVAGEIAKEAGVEITGMPVLRYQGGPARRAQPQKPTVLGTIFTIFFFLAMIYLFVKHPRLMILLLLFSGMGRRGSWGGGGGGFGGGFGGGGGGGFGGGGASGGW